MNDFNSVSASCTVNGLDFRTPVLTTVLFCFMDSEIFFVFPFQELVAAEKKKQTVAEQVMIDHLSR